MNDSRQVSSRQKHVRRCPWLGSGSMTVPFFIISLAIINPWRMRSRVMVVIPSLCVSVTMKSATYLVYRSKTKCGVFKVFVVWLSLNSFIDDVHVASRMHE